MRKTIPAVNPANAIAMLRIVTGLLVAPHGIRKQLPIVGVVLLQVDAAIEAQDGRFVQAGPQGSAGVQERVVPLPRRGRPASRH